MNSKVPMGIFCGVSAVGAAVLFYVAGSFKKGTSGVDSTYGPAFFPRIMLGVILIGSIALAVQTFLTKTTKSGQSGSESIDTEPDFDMTVTAIPAQNEGDSGSLWGVIRTAAVLLLSIAFYFAWSFWGFFIPSIIFLSAVSLVLGERNIIKFGGIAIAGPIIFLVFEKLLNVRL